MFRRSLIVGSLALLSIGFSFADFQSDIQKCNTSSNYSSCTGKVEKKYTVSKIKACKMKDGDYKLPLQVNRTKGKTVSNSSFKKVGRELFYNVYVYTHSDIENGLNYFYSYNCNTKKATDLSKNFNISNDLFTSMLYVDDNYLVVTTNCGVGECSDMPLLIDKRTKVTKDLFKEMGIDKIYSTENITLNQKNGKRLQDTKKTIENYYNNLPKDEKKLLSWFEAYIGQFVLLNISKNTDGILQADIAFKLNDSKNLIISQFNLITQTIDL